MKKELALSVLLTLSAPLFAQTLPDEINYPPYQQQFQKLTQDTESALGELNGVKSDLEDIRRAISNSLGQISSLQNQNSSLSNQISANQNRIPQLRSELNSEEYQINNLNRAINDERSREQSINSSLQDRIRALRPAEERLSRALQTIRSLEAELSRAISQEQSASRELSSLQSKISQVESQISRERSEQQSLKGQLASLNTRISQSESKLSSLRSQLSSQESSLSTAQSKVNALRSTVSGYESEVSRLRASGAPAAEIQAAERKLNASQNKLNEEESSVRSLQSSVSSIKSSISREESELASLRRDQTSLPSRISQSEREEQRLVNERAQLSNRVQTQQRELISAQNVRQSREAQLRQEENQNRSLQVEVDRLRSQVASLENDLQNSRRQIQNLQSQQQNASNRAQNLRRDISDLEAEIPRLQQSIRSNSSQIASLEGQVQSLRNSEQQTIREISSLDKKYNDLVVKRNSAQGQYETRLSLYRRYESEASSLGSSQVKGAEESGKKDGSAFAKKRSADLSRQLSNELGEADGKHIAIINIGYPIGMSSESDIKEGARQGAIEGKKEAIRHAQTQLKPQFFEEILVSELAKPVSENFDGVSVKMASAMEVMEIFAELPALSAAEMQEANQIKTVLDKDALSLASQVAEIKKKVSSLSQAGNSYQTPSSIPYGTVNCAQVYKGVSAFKKVCEASYTADFAYIYKSAYSNIFSLEYPALFQSQYAPLLSSKRVAVFDASFAGYQKIGKEEGIAQGKVVIFNQTFEQTRAATYEQEIGPATDIARADARAEVSEWVSSHPMVTASSVKSDLARLRGGDVGSVVFSLKNISPVALKENIVIQVKETQLADVSSKVVTVSNLKGQSVTAFKDMKFTVSSSARSGQKVVIKGDLLLPGDKYQAQRKESFVLEKALAANPAFNIQTVFDSTPKIKNIFGYKTHQMKIKIAPKFERLDLGYQIELVPSSEFAKLINIQNKVIETRGIDAGALKEFAFTYKFHKDARKKTVPFNLNIIYDGEIIQSYKIEMKPYRAIF
jgi:predicted  nucleic acid-binding Zn-ribbon protein